MKFFDRKRKIAKLREIRERSRETSTFTVMTGRRRVGKTELVKRAFSDEPFVYFFVTRSAEADLCDVFRQRIEEFTGRSIPGKILDVLRGKAEVFFLKNPDKRKLTEGYHALSLSDL